MGNTIGIDFDTDHMEMETDMGQSLSWNDVEYPACVSFPVRYREYEDDGSGHYDGRQMVATVRVSAIGDDVQVGDQIMYEKEYYRIENIETDSTHGIYRIECKGLAL